MERPKVVLAKSSAAQVPPERDILHTNPLRISALELDALSHNIVARSLLSHIGVSFEPNRGKISLPGPSGSCMEYIGTIILHYHETTNKKITRHSEFLVVDAPLYPFPVFLGGLAVNGRSNTAPYPGVLPILEDPKTKGMPANT